MTPTNEGSSLADASPQPSVELTAGAGSHGCLPGDYGFGKNAAATLLARLGAFVCELLGASNCQTVKGLPATDDGEYQYEIRSASKATNRVVTESELTRLRLTASVPLLCAVRDVSHFGPRHLVSKPHPGLSHTKPKRFVSGGFRSARHRYTLLNQMLVNSNFHCTILRAHRRE